MSISSSDEEPQTKNKRGVTNIEKYKRNVIRNAGVKSEAFTNYKGEKVPSKSVPAELMCKCRGNCSLIIDDVNTNLIRNYFYSLQNKNVQCTHLQALIEVCLLYTSRCV